MRELPRFGVAPFLGLLVVVALAAGARAWYLGAATENGALAPSLRVQDSEAERAALVQNLVGQRWFGGQAPLAEADEETAHVAPGYPWLLGLVGRYAAAPDQVVRCLQCGLGTLTVLCYFFFARRAFGSNRVAFLSGLFGAVYPFWVCATAELADGILASFLLAASLALGTRGSQVGGAFTSLLFGLALAALAMVRAALLPFALVAMLWFLWRCRQYRWGWFAALLALLGFANGLAPWGVRNYRIFGEMLPVVSSTYLHLWMGNNPDATGGPLDEQELRSSLSDARRQEVLAEPNQARRYALLGKDSLAEIAADPAAAFGRRFTAAETFVLGQRWREHRQLGLAEQAEGIAEPPAWLREHFDLLLNGSLVALLALALLGWRWTYAWAWHARLATLAVIWIPLPYVLSHGEALSGPRLPLDGVLLCYAAYAALAWLPERPRAPDAPAA